MDYSMENCFNIFKKLSVLCFIQIPLNMRRSLLHEEVTKVDHHDDHFVS